MNGMSEADGTTSTISSLADEFPCVQQGQYFNHAAIAPWPRRTTAAVTAFAQENMLHGPAHYASWIRREQYLREQAATLIGATAASDIAWLKNTTEGISTVAWGLEWKAGDNIVLPRDEFASNRLPWLAQQVHGVEVREIDIRAGPHPPAGGEFGAME
jgi:selenocysteine lyase/cysteine desulfurase